MTTIQELRDADIEPESLSASLIALWCDARGDWPRAHHLVQDDDSPEAAWVHAYLHRREGDIDNARYWYHRARKPVASEPLEDEWEQIAAALLSAN